MAVAWRRHAGLSRSRGTGAALAAARARVGPRNCRRGAIAALGAAMMLVDQGAAKAEAIRNVRS